MKLLLKALLILAVMLGVFYASSPWWLPVILAKQLPPGWQLESINMSWPGLSGIKLKNVQARGKLPGLTLTVEAQNSRLSYRGLATTIDAAVLHVYLPSSQQKPPVPVSIDDLSLPMFQLSASLPSLTVKQTQLALHLASDSLDSNTGQTIVIAMQGFKLDPADRGHYQLDTIASIVGQQNINGQLKAEVSPEKLLAQVRFPADNALPAWLNLVFTQLDEPGTTESKLALFFDADATGDQWLDALLSKSTDGKLTHVGGQLQAQAVFNGAQIRHFTTMSANASNFQLGLDGDTVEIHANIQAKREAQIILLKFADTDHADKQDSDAGSSDAGRISLLDRNARIETTIASLVPELTRSIKAAPGSEVNSVAAATDPTTTVPSNPDMADPGVASSDLAGFDLARAELTIARGSQLVVNLPENTLTKPSLIFDGRLALDYSTSSSSVQLDFSDLNIGIADLEQTGKYDLAGELSLNWKEQEPFSYVSDTLSLAANSLQLKASGKLVLAPEQTSFKPTGRIDAKLPGLQAKIQTGETSAAGWIELSADDIETTQAQLGFELPGPADASQTSYSFKGPLQATNPRITIFSSANPEMTVVTASGLSLTATLSSGADHLKSSGNGYLSKAKVMPLAANASRLDLKWTELDLANLTGALDAKTEGFNITVDEQMWTGFNLDTNLKLLRNDNIKGSGQVSFGSGSGWPIEFSGNTKTNWWDLNLLGTKLPLADLRSVLRSAHIDLPKDLKLTAGSIEISGLIQVHEDMSAQLDLSGSEIAAELAQSNARQASFRFSSGFLKDIFAAGPIAVERLELAGGIDITDINTEITVADSQTFGFSKLNANLFDGQLKIDQLNYAGSAIEDTVISLTHINLQKLLAFLDMDGLEGTGFIDFSLPAGSKGKAIHIVDGTFTSTGPGRLAYSKGNLASTNIGLQAMDNFHYKSLSGKIAYDSTGPYQITIRLEGSNPDLYSGYPVIFNLTINGSLPELFEAMFITGSFEESILKQVKMK